MSKTIQLPRGLVTTVDEQDYELLSSMSWHRDRSGYVRHSIRVREGVCKAVYMHRLLMSAAPHEQVDHRDGDKLNNTRQNLRITDASGNARNKQKTTRRATSSIYKGVSFNKNEQKWAAYITKSRKRTFLGYFASEELAALAYNKAASQHHGAFAKLNPIGDAADASARR